jgi:murein DD-endopeptidase MepM/ murein hydrolase activator NlpD
MTSSCARFLIALAMSLFFWSTPLAQAQDGNPGTSPESEITIHIVQRDETLFQIAQTYGTTIDALTTLNSLLDPEKLQIGQRLMIPGSRINSSGLLTTHVVQPGETIEMIATRYNSTPDSLSLVNYILNARSLYLGQSILVTQGASGELPDEQVSLHIVQPGDYLMRLSVKYAVPIFELAEANELDVMEPLQLGQRIVIPGTSNAHRFVDLPAPLTDFQLGPLPAEQGRSISLSIQAEEDLTITGRMFDKDVRFVADRGSQRAIIGIHSFTEPGLYPISLTMTDATGQQFSYENRIRVVDGGYGQENIDIPPERQGLLDPSLVQAELERVADLMSGFTEQKYFRGLMSLPSTGPVTSQYGTRRSYSGSPVDSFHGGADFGGAAGSIILAPADGIVVLAETLQVRGNAVIIDHGWGGYWHNTELFVQAGQFVQRNDALSSLGDTGLVTGAHLHWEMWISGVQVDPLQWLTYDFDQFDMPTETASLN